MSIKPLYDTQYSVCLLPGNKVIAKCTQLATLTLKRACNWSTPVYKHVSNIHMQIS